VRQRARLTQILEQDIELAVAWGIKEHVRQLLAARDTSTFQREWAALTRAVRATRLPEPVALFKTLTAWRGELLTFARTRVTNARSEAANLTAKTFKRIGRGYRNHDNYRRRIIGYAPRPIAA
jgi:transposase